MTRIASFARITAVALVAAVLAVPAFAQARGSADFTRYYAIGDSLTAGYESGSLNVNHQQFSYPAVIARQVGLRVCEVADPATAVCFAQPLIQYPGLPTGESQLTLIGSSVVPFPAPGTGAPLVTGFGRTYNNVGVPGYTLAAALALKGSEANSGLGQVVLRGLGSEVDQVAAASPTFITIWLGANDILGPLSQGSPTGLPDPATFKTQYAAMLDKLIAAAPNAGMVVGNLPATAAALPLTSALPTVVFDSNLQPAIINGGTIPLIFSSGGVTQPVPAGSVVLLSALPKIQTGVGITGSLKPFPPFSTLPNLGVPLTDADVLTPTEIAAFVTSAAALNQAINEVASARKVPVADMSSLFARFGSKSGIAVGPVVLTNQFVRGGLFSLDGTHLTDIAYTMVANEFIKTINTSYGTRIPLASFTTFFQNNDPTLVKDQSIHLSVDSAAMKAVSDMLTSTMQQPQPARRRASH
jgi:lysophospholipase L1-like esterase